MSTTRVVVVPSDAVVDSLTFFVVLVVDSLTSVVGSAIGVDEAIVVVTISLGVVLGLAVVIFLEVVEKKVEAMVLSVLTNVFSHLQNNSIL